jgi:hypothetical protein
VSKPRFGKITGIYRFQYFNISDLKISGFWFHLSCSTRLASVTTFTVTLNLFRVCSTPRIQQALTLQENIKLKNPCLRALAHTAYSV